MIRRYYRLLSLRICSSSSRCHYCYNSNVYGNFPNRQLRRTFVPDTCFRQKLVYDFARLDIMVLLLLKLFTSIWTTCTISFQFRDNMARLGRSGFLAIAVVFHLVYIKSIFDIYFISPIVSGMRHFPADSEKAPAKRLFLFVGPSFNCRTPGTQLICFYRRWTPCR